MYMGTSYVVSLCVHPFEYVFCFCVELVIRFPCHLYFIQAGYPAQTDPFMDDRPQNPTHAYPSACQNSWIHSSVDLFGQIRLRTRMMEGYADLSIRALDGLHGSAYVGPSQNLL
jgi:hypothetical protein